MTQQRMRLRLLAGVVAVFSAGIGIGGGAILVPALIRMGKFDFRRASGLSLATIAPISLVGAVTHVTFLDGVFPIRILAAFIAAGAVGVAAGNLMLERVPTPAFTFVFAAMLDEHNLTGQNLEVRCRVLDSVEAIGSPTDRDYPILRGREHMVEAILDGFRGQAFADEFENLDGPVERLLDMDLSTNARRAIFIAGLNAVCRRCGVCEKTVHCRDEEPRDCAKHLHEIIPAGEKVLLAGLQPRFLEALAPTNPVRAIDLDPRNIGERRFGIEIESADATADAIAWCDRILATGSTIVNGTITEFLASEKPVVFFGVTICAPAAILDLETYCHAPAR